MLSHPCFPQAIQLEQMILFSFSSLFHFFLDLLLCHLSLCRFTFLINSGSAGQYWLRIIMCESSPIVFWEKSINKGTRISICTLIAPLLMPCFRESRCFSSLMTFNLLLINPLNLRSCCQIFGSHFELTSACKEKLKQMKTNTWQVSKLYKRQQVNFNLWDGMVFFLPQMLCTITIKGFLAVIWIIP